MKRQNVNPRKTTIHAVLRTLRPGLLMCAAGAIWLVALYLKTH